MERPLYTGCPRLANNHNLESVLDFFVCEIKHAPVATIKLRGVVHLCEISSPVIMPHVWSTAKIFKGHGQTARMRPKPENPVAKYSQLKVDGCGNAEPYWQSVNTAPPPMDFDKKADEAFKDFNTSDFGFTRRCFYCLFGLFFCHVGGIFSLNTCTYILNNYHCLSHEL